MCVHECVCGRVCQSNVCVRAGVRIYAHVRVHVCLRARARAYYVSMHVTLASIVEYNMSFDCKYQTFTK